GTVGQGPALAAVRRLRDYASLHGRLPRRPVPENGTVGPGTLPQAGVRSNLPRKGQAPLPGRARARGVGAGLGWRRPSACESSLRVTSEPRGSVPEPVMWPVLIAVFLIGLGWRL